MAVSLNKRQFAASVSVHVIEPQALFIDSLGEIFAEVGLELPRVSKDADFRELLDEQPRVLFVDVDFSTQEPLKLITLLRTLLPKALIAIYTSQRSAEWAKATHFAGANAVISKAAERSEIVEGLRQMLETGEFIDVRLRTSVVDKGDIER